MSNITQMRVKGVDYDLSNIVNSTKTNSLENLDCSKNLIYAVVNKPTKFSLKGGMQIGQKIKLFIISNGNFSQVISDNNIKTDFGAGVKLKVGDIVQLNIECYDTNKYFINGRGVNPITYYILVSTNSSGSTTIDKYTNQEGTETEPITIPADSTDYKVDNLRYGFRVSGGARYISKLDTAYLNTSNMTNMSNMFNSCSALTSLDLSSFDTSKVTNMSNMFYGCGALTHIKCKQAFKNWCWTNQDTISLPSAMRSDGSGRWEIVG